MQGFELSASVAIWRGREVLLMKRAGGVGSGGWFLPGGHVEPGERPVDAAVREVKEETGIVLDRESLSLADVMSYDVDGLTAHTLIFNAGAPESAEAVINEEHHVARWYTPDMAIQRFYNAERLVSLGVSEANIALALEVARVLRSAQHARGMATEASEERPLFGAGEPGGDAGLGAA
jgi:8-oxo-dGTP diphosphatase